MRLCIILSTLAKISIGKHNFEREADKRIRLDWAASAKLTNKFFMHNFKLNDLKTPILFGMNGADSWQRVRDRNLIDY